MHRRNPLAIFMLLAFFQLPNPTLADKIVTGAGWLGALVAAGSVLYQIAVPLSTYSGWENLLVRSGTFGFLVYLGAIVIVGTRYLGQSDGVNGFGMQIVAVARRLLLYGLLPALVILAILLGLAYLSGNLSS